MPGQHSPTPSLRAVAKLAGVSAMTVSRVLRSHPSVSPRVRQLVQKAVRELGYRPDPHVAKLMHHLRLRRKPAYQASICAITTLPRNSPHAHYFDGVVSGLSRQAEARGYGFSIVHITELEESARTLQRILRGRGVEGVVLLPMAQPADLSHLLDWREFSVVATTSSVLAPAVHTVVPHHFRNTQLLCRKLEARGYRRIGLVLERSHMERVYHAFNAAITWHGLFEHGRFVPSLIYRGATPASLAKWFAQEQPDVIVTHTERLCRTFAHTLGLKIPGRVGFVSINTVPNSEFAGIDEVPADIGGCAADLLTSMVQRSEKGIPALPAATLLQGKWLDGASCPRRRPIEPSPNGGGMPALIYRDE